jgi:hypothetical protein
VWIERLFPQVQKKHPVRYADDHQQACPLCDRADAKLGESGTNHPQAMDSDFVNVR